MTSENDNESPEEIVKWTLRGINEAASSTTMHDPFGDETLRYLQPPTPYVHYLMVEFNFSRRKAELIADIT